MEENVVIHAEKAILDGFIQNEKIWDILQLGKGQGVLCH